MAETVDLDPVVLYRFSRTKTLEIYSLGRVDGGLGSRFPSIPVEGELYLERPDWLNGRNWPETRLNREVCVVPNRLYPSGHN